MSLKVAKCHRNCLYFIDHHFLLGVCSNNVTVLHRFPDITTSTFTVYVTSCDISKSFSFENTVAFTSTFET